MSTGKKQNTGGGDRPPSLRRKPGSKALAEIDTYQGKFFANLLHFKPCKRLIDAQLRQVNPLMKIRRDAVQRIIDALEAHTVMQFKVCQVMAIHAGRVTIKPEDMANAGKIFALFRGEELREPDVINAALARRQKRAQQRADEARAAEKRERRRERAQKLKRQKEREARNRTTKHVTSNDRIHKEHAPRQGERPAPRRRLVIGSSEEEEEDGDDDAAPPPVEEPEPEERDTHERNDDASTVMQFLEQGPHMHQQARGQRKRVKLGPFENLMSSLNISLTSSGDSCDNESDDDSFNMAAFERGGESMDEISM